MNVIETSGLGKRYGSTWALRDCSLAIPAGHVAALVGPNGAGKTTLLHLAVGLAAPSAGGVTVLGGRPAGSPAALDGIAFVAQDTPLYNRWCMPAGPRHRPTCWSGPPRTTRSRRAGRRTRSAWRNSPLPTCASPAPRRCPARPAAGTPNRRR
jgi:energy-coupling factor transporter ATP-binding protein EcfA2